MQSALDYGENIINTVREPLLILDQQLVVMSANKSFYDTFKLRKSDIEGVELFKIGDGDWNISSLKNLLEGSLKENSEINDFEFVNNFKKVGHKKMLLNARKIYRGDINTEMILLAMEI
jgi:two-component system, chemotaxis family, CheB/CheR fusion protein